jgi:two-component system NarL family sensor kinase
MRRLALVRYTAAGVLVLLLVGAATAAISVRVARHRALTAAEDGGQRIATRVAPIVDHDLYDGDTAALTAVDDRVRIRKSGRGDIERVKVWSDRGVILYCDDPRLIGQRFPLGADERDTMAGGGVDSRVSDLTDSENVLERHLGKGLEVHAGTRDADGRPIIVETYFATDELDGDQAALVRRTVPAVLVPVTLLALLLVPIARRRATRRATRRPTRPAG